MWPTPLLPALLAALAALLAWRLVAAGRRLHRAERALASLDREVAERDRRAAEASRRADAAEARAEAARRRFAVVAEASKDAVVCADPEGRVTWANAAARDLFSLPALEGRQVGEMVPKRGDGEAVVARPDGTRVPVSVRHATWQEPDGPHEALLVHDASLRKAAQEDLRESEARFRRLSETAFEGVAIEEGGRVLDANGTFARMLGYAPEEMPGRSVAAFFAPASRETLLDSRLRRDERPLELEAQRKDGGTFFAEVSARAVPFHGRDVLVVGVRDVTRLRRLEAELQHARAEAESGRRMASMGLAATSAAQALGAPVRSLRMSAEVLAAGLRRALDSDSTKADLTRAVVAALANEEILMTDIERLERITKTLDEATRFEEGEPAPEDVNELADGVLQRALAHLAPGIRVHKEYLASAPAFVARREVSDVLEALVRNAAEAMAPQGSGDLTVLTMDTPERVVIEVTDTGPATRPGDPRRLLAPFVPHLPGAPGAAFVPGAPWGQGVVHTLTTGHRILDAHGGRLSFMAHPGSGATFRLEVPVAAPRPPTR